MSVILTCVNGHQTTVRDDAEAARTTRCPECGKPLSAEQTTVSRSRRPEPTAEVPPARTRPERSGANTRRAGRGKWLVVVGIGVVLMAGAAVGTFLLLQSRNRAPDPVKDREAARQTVVRFMEVSKEGQDEAAALALFTDKARAGLQKKGKGGSNVPKFRPGQTVEVGDAAVAGDRAEVPVITREAGEEERMVILLRRQGRDWRVYGVSAQFDPADPESRMTINFEDPKALAKEFLGVDPEQLGKDWAKEMDEKFKKSMEEAFSPAPKADDLANEALAPMDRPAFKATWQAHLDVKGKPAGEVLKELAAALGTKVEATPVQDKALARPITVQLKGRSRRELVEEVCRRVGMYPEWGEKFGGDNKPVPTLSLKPAPQPLPVAYAGPFVVEVQELAEFPPHATGQLTFRVSAAGLPPVVAKMMGSGLAADVVAVTQVTDNRGRDLSDLGPNGLGLAFGQVRADGYDRTSELPLKNLLRDATEVKSVRGRVRVRLPSKVDSVRFDMPKAGAVGKAGSVEVKLATYHAGEEGFDAKKKYPTASLRLAYKGVHPDRVRLVAYDADQKLIAVSSSGYSGSADGGESDFTVRGHPAALVAKVISAEPVDYEFAFADLPLTAAAKMPEKLTPATFPGHDRPVTFEFVRVVSANFPSKVQFRVVNHADKDVRSADLKLFYLDAKGGQVGEWPHQTQRGSDQKGPRVLVGKQATAVVETDAPFFPAGAQAVRAEVAKVVFADAQEWTPPKAKK